MPISVISYHLSDCTKNTHTHDETIDCTWFGAPFRSDYLANALYSLFENMSPKLQLLTFHFIQKRRCVKSSTR